MGRFRYSYREVTKRGKQDGRDWKWRFWPLIKEPKAVEPKTDQTQASSYETEIIHAAEFDMQKVADELAELDKKLKADYCEALREYKEAEDAFNKEAREVPPAAKEFEAARRELLNIEQPDLSPKWRTFWLVAIGIAEFPINALVFQIFGENQLLTYIMAATMCFGIPIAAHFLGHSARQESKTNWDKALIWLIPVGALFVLCGLAFVRSKFFEAVLQENVIGISMTPTEATVLFLIINIFIFFVAFLISYYGSYPQGRFYRTARKRYETALGKYQKESSEARVAKARLESASKRHDSARHHRQKIFEKHQQKASIIKEQADWYAASYRAANLRERRDFPPCFQETAATAQMPLALTKIDWDCPDIAHAKEEVENETA